MIYWRMALQGMRQSVIGESFWERLPLPALQLVNERPMLQRLGFVTWMRRNSDHCPQDARWRFPWVRIQHLDRRFFHLHD
jgi:hypothetical protein